GLDLMAHTPSYRALHTILGNHPSDLGRPIGVTSWSCPWFGADRKTWTTIHRYRPISNPLQFAVGFRTKENHQTGQEHPKERHHHTGEGPVVRGLVRDVVEVEGKPESGEHPPERSHHTAGADPFPSAFPPRGSEPVVHRQEEHQKN